VFVGHPVLLRRDRIGTAFGEHCLCLIGCLAALMMASEAGAEVRFGGTVFYAVGNSPHSVAVADFGTAPDVVTANEKVFRGTGSAMYGRQR
jgi:hypothetical protein